MHTEPSTPSVSTTSTIRKFRKWFDIPLKTKTKKEILAMRMKRELESIPKRGGKRVNIMKELHADKSNELANKKKGHKVVRQAAEKMWERKQRITEIGKKSSRCNSTGLNEKKYFKIGTKINKTESKS